MCEIKFSPLAVSDLQEIRAYIAEELCSEQTAVNVLAKITKRIRELAKFPQMGASLSAIVDFDTNYRFLVCGNYIAFYYFENQIVYIVRISLWPKGLRANSIRRAGRLKTEYHLKIVIFIDGNFCAQN